MMPALLEVSGSADSGKVTCVPISGSNDWSSSLAAAATTTREASNPPAANTAGGGGACSNSTLSQVSIAETLAATQRSLDLSKFDQGFQEKVKSKATLDAAVASIDGALRALARGGQQLPGPELRDLWMKRPYKPLVPMPTRCPEGFPWSPLAVKESPEFFVKLSLSTLMFAFYYQSGTREQYLAARELKRRGWRFHTQLRSWFHRQGQPTAITDTMERGNFIYFDDEHGWCTRTREDFVFEYTYLEDEIPIE